MSSVALIIEKNGNIKECKIKDIKSEYEINILCGNKKRDKVSNKLEYRNG